MSKKNSKSFFNNVGSMFGMSSDQYDDFEDIEEETEYEVEDIKHFKTHKNNVVDINTASASVSSSSPRVFISKPGDFDEATVIVDNLKSKKIVVVNTNNIEGKVGQRLLDFISGATYALGAELQQIDKGVYLLSPANVEVDNSLKGELGNKSVFNFMK